MGGSFGGGRGGGPARRPPGGQPPATGSGEKPKREAILDLARYNDERIRVKFAGGRESTPRSKIRLSLDLCNSPSHRSSKRV